MTARLSSGDRQLALAALQLIATAGWDACTPARLGQALKRAPEVLAKTATPPRDLLPLLVAYISFAAAAQLGPPDRTASPHDRLFEVLMARLDILQMHRAAILSIAAAARRDPALALMLIRAQAQAMPAMMQLAGIGPPGRAQLLATGGLGLLYLGVLYQWQHDESPDMAKTMAFLDRNLRRAGRVAENLRRLQKRPFRMQSHLTGRK